MIEKLIKRIEELEKRVVKLEGYVTPVNQSETLLPNNSQLDPTSIIKIALSNKRYQPEDHDIDVWQDHIWFDVAYLPENLEKPTRAVKGVLEVMDLFDEVKFQLRITLNERLEPGKKFVQQAIGFEYNQFREDHQWMLETDEKDLKSVFRVSNIIFEDLTKKSY